MFLLRCLFWLGLVFSQIAQKEGVNASALAVEAMRLASPDAGQALALSKTALAAAGQRCRVEPTACLALSAPALRASH
jgi:hypothetical protein